ncbi:MAG: diaminopimelate decarboxylase [Cyclobacteriaceae bacterium]
MSVSQFFQKFQSLETPFYFYDIALLRKTLIELKQCLGDSQFHVHYAMKSNVNRRILNEVKAFGLGADCVSGNEVKRALEVGFSADQIVFAGVGKTDKEIQFGLEHDIFAFNVESIEELKVLDEMAGRMGKKTRFALRVNPNVEAGTHKYITTGTRDNKFGITIEELWEALDLVQGLKHAHFIGIHFHIGSQINDLSRFIELAGKVTELQKELVKRGFELPHVNVGGGLGIDYDDPDATPIANFKEYFELFKKHLQLLPGQQLHFELGRSITGQCGSLISKVLYTKPGKDTTFAILDSGMTELIRPALYQASHKIENLTSNAEFGTYDIVGPICESSDAFARGISLPKTQRGDLMAVRSTGAYGEVMANRYNLREIAPSIYSDDLV